MPYCTDKQVVERLLIPAMLAVVITAVRRGLGETSEPLEHAAQLLTKSLREPIEGLSAANEAKLIRRAKRVTEEAMAPLHDLVVGVQLLAIAYFVTDLTEKGILVVGAESPFAKAWDIITAVLDCAWDQLHKDCRASQVASELWERLVARGYFRETPIGTAWG